MKIRVGAEGVAAVLWIMVGDCNSVFCPLPQRREAFFLKKQAKKEKQTFSKMSKCTPFAFLLCLFIAANGENAFSGKAVSHKLTVAFLSVCPVSR